MRVVWRAWGINNAVVSYAELTATQWLDRSDEEAARIAHDIVDRHELRLVALRWHWYAGRTHRVALFDRAGVAFALVPGGQPVLGHDGGGIMTFQPDGGVEVRFDADGQLSRARARAQVSYDDAVDRVVGLGLRLCTPYEWEYACGAGVETLFRWGDDTPESGYPHDHRTGPHREANLWGLAIGQDPYRQEWTSTRAIVCGGDGGGATCGGSGFLVGWVTIATDYRDPEFGAWLNSGDGYTDELLVRPVIDLV